MTTVTIFKALADETRLRLLRILLHHELSVNELVSILKMGQSRISRHLRVLSDAGLTTFRRDGLWVFYQANQDADVQKFLKTLAPYLDRIPEAPEDTVETNRILEEKNAKTQHFFNSVAENWDNLNKKILGSYDLPKTVCEAIPDNCGLAVDLGCGTGAVLLRMLSRARNVVALTVPRPCWTSATGASRNFPKPRRAFPCASEASSICPCAIRRPTSPPSISSCTISRCLPRPLPRRGAS